MARKSRLYCSFCRKDDRRVQQLIAGPGVHICGACVDQCVKILRDEPTEPFLGWSSLDDEELLSSLVPSVATVDRVREVVQEQVDLLRGRGVSWSRIGDALGISRQAAWERFA